MKKYRITRIDSHVYGLEINHLEKPELIDFSKGIHPTGAELSYNKEVKEWQEAEDNLDKEEYELNQEASDYFKYFANFPKGFEFYGELVDGKLKITQ